MLRYFKKINIKRAVILLTALFLCLCIFAGCNRSHIGEGDNTDSLTLPTAELSQGPLQGQISAKSAVVMEMSSGQIIWDKAPNEKLPMASTTKIMTALVALERCETDTVVKIPAEAVGIEGSSIYLYEGERLTMENLLYAMLLESANDAATAIAIAVGGSVEGFSRLMNERANTLGLVSTSFENPHGLDGKNHYTTAKELALITREAMKNETFRKIVSTYKTTIPLNDSEGVRLLVNHNKLLKNYSGALGVKTGFTKKSGRCLVSAAERDGVEYICVTINAPSDWNDHRLLLDYASSLYELRTLCSAGEISHSLPVTNSQTDFVRASNRDTVKKIMTRNSENVEVRIELPRFLMSSVKAGDVAGRAVFYSSGEEIASVPLYYEEGVSQNTNKKGWFSRLFG